MSYLDELSEKDLSKSQLASLRRLEKKATMTVAMEMDDALAEALEKILAAIVELRAAVAGLPPPVVNVTPPEVLVPPPIVNVPEVDLSDIVTAVTGLKPGADASEIAAAIVDRLQLPTVPDASGPLAEVAEALKKLEFRMRGIGAQAYGGGSSQLQAQGPDGGWRSVRINEAGELVVTTSESGGGGAVDTELPAAAALADDSANPTAPAVGSFLMGFDGTTWDRIKSVTDAGDAQAAASVGNLRARASMMLFNGTTWDRVRGDTANGLDVDVTRTPRATTPAQSTVAGSASSVTLLASSAARMGATIYNDSSAVLYVKLGATASTSSFTVKMVADGYYEVPFGYSGVIDGIWASATGNARITELTA